MYPAETYHRRNVTGETYSGETYPSPINVTAKEIRLNPSIKENKPQP